MQKIRQQNAYNVIIRRVAVKPNPRICQPCVESYDIPEGEKDYSHCLTDGEYCPIIKGCVTELHGFQGPQGPYYRRFEELEAREWEFRARCPFFLEHLVSQRC